MTTERTSFIGKWRPATTGEQLLHFLVTNAAELKEVGPSTSDWLAGVSRSQAIAGFLHGIVVLHVFGRLLQAAKAYRARHVDDEANCLSLIETFSIDKLGITRATCNNFEGLAPLALDAARASSKNSHSVSQGKRREVQEEFRGAFAAIHVELNSIHLRIARKYRIPKSLGAIFRIFASLNTSISGHTPLAAIRPWRTWHRSACLATMLKRTVLLGNGRWFSRYCRPQILDSLRWNQSILRDRLKCRCI